MGLRSVASVGQVLPSPSRVRRRRRRTHRGGQGRSSSRRTPRRLGGADAQPVLRRCSHEPRRDRRSAGHPAHPRGTRRRPPRWPGRSKRLRRHPDVLARLVDELDRGRDELLVATIAEVQRCRPVVDTTFRAVTAPSYQLGPWTLPRGQTIAIAIGLVHDDEAAFADHRAFAPDRFVGVEPDGYDWVPFGVGRQTVHRRRLRLDGVARRADRAARAVHPRPHHAARRAPTVARRCDGACAWRPRGGAAPHMIWRRNVRARASGADTG